MNYDTTDFVTGIQNVPENVVNIHPNAYGRRHYISILRKVT
jgi:hypothetical protein